MKTIGFIPARSGSKRVQHKNIKALNGHPLIAYTICAAVDSGMFDRVICVTDDETYASVARHYGAEVPILRPSEISGDKSSDIEWVMWILNELNAKDMYEAFSILRPTSPFRKQETIKRACALFESEGKYADSLRAIEKCKQHPGKMWIKKDKRILPLMPFSNGNVPWHSSQYSALPEIYVQNASLEIAWISTALEKKSIAGDSIIPFLTEGFEGFDINEPQDWILAEHFLASGEAQLPIIQHTPYFI